MSRCRSVYKLLAAVLEPTGCSYRGLKQHGNGTFAPAAANSLLQDKRETTCTCHRLQSIFSRPGSSLAANEIKKGMLLEQDGGRKLLDVQESFHSAGQARQGGFVSIDCRDVHTGAKSKMKLAPNKAVEVADTQWRKMQFLYTDEEGVHVMDMENFEQFCVSKESASAVLDWLQDGLEVSALMHDDSPVMIEMLPSQITVQVEETMEARVSVASSRKAAVVNTGATVMVPSFVQKGEFIIVTPSNGEFVKRASS